jgi:predicted dehydrogenase
MKFLVVGLGSMGKRRVRNLLALKQKEIAGFDTSETRCEESKKKYDIETYSNFQLAIKNFKPDVLIISTPPNFHMEYAYFAFENNLHAFIEASVVDSEKIIALYEKNKKKNLILAPSCTMGYFPAQLKLKELLNKNIIGEPLNFNYHSGQYLPDWHPWEKIEDFYVSNRNTGGCREIVPFELTWINQIFGNPKPLSCVKRKLTDMNANIDDIYHNILEYPNKMILNLTVEVISRPEAVRDFRVLGTIGEIVYSSDTQILRYKTIHMDKWHEYSFENGTIESEYINPEEPYINEMNDFLNAVNTNDTSLFPNSLLNDYHVLKTLYALEDLTGENHDLSR